MQSIWRSAQYIFTTLLYFAHGLRIKTLILRFSGSSNQISEIFFSLLTVWLRVLLAVATSHCQEQIQTELERKKFPVAEN